MSINELRDRLPEVVDAIARSHERVTITRDGRPAALLVSADYLESLEETLDILSDPTALRELREAKAGMDRGEYTTGEEMSRILRERLRRETGDGPPLPEP